jgi:putative transposase
MFRAFKIRLRLTRKQETAFEEILRDSQETYNAALQERRDAWRMEHKNIGYNDQCGELTELRKDPQFAVIALDIQREPLRRVDKAFKAFYRRCKSGEKPGYPRFRSRDRYDSFAWHDPSIRENFLRIPNLGVVRFKTHRDIEGKAKQVIVKRCGQKWTARVICDIGEAPAKVAVSSAVGIDLGLTAFVTLSDGSAIENPRWTRKHEARIAAANRKLALKQKRSKNRLKAKEVLRRAHQRAADARLNYIHHISKWLVSNYDLIAYEDLKIRNMARSASGTVENPGTNVAQKSGLNRSIMDAAWGLLIWCIVFKAEYAGKWAVPVNPRNTSQMCSGCGRIVPKKLSERTHSCECGLVLGRDHNAGINIKQLGLHALGRSAAGLLPSIG